MSARDLDLLDEPLIRTEGAGRLTLPGLFAAMARDAVRGFPALRPHQRPAWHMVVVQLAALAWRGRDLPLAEDEGSWRDALLALTGGDPGPWALIGPEDAPAFLQPAVVPPMGELIPTPDALDMLITAKNHDLKQQVAREAAPDDWIFALVSLQTMEGYSGRSNFGIARMNGGSSSRVLLGLCPGGPGAPDPSAWWRRDVGILLREGVQGKGLLGGPALIWTLPWPEGSQLALTDLDPLFIEVCRRVRLGRVGGRIVAWHRGSAKARIDAESAHGVTGDPWCPVHLAKAKALTLGDRRFDFRLLSELIWGNDKGRVWVLPPLARPRPGERDMLLVAEALARGNSRTDGFMSRIVPVPAGEGWLEPSAGEIARAQIAEITLFDKALRDSLALFAAGGRRKAVNEGHRALTREARARFEAFADAIFFEHLWRRLGDSSDGPRRAFLQTLFAAARDELDRGMAAIPVPAIWQLRAEVEARAAFHRTLRGDATVVALLFPKETTDERDSDGLAA